MQSKKIKCKLTSTIRDLYSYNIWRTNKLYGSLKTNIEKNQNFLDVLIRNEGLYLKSVKGTLNHILAADILYFLRLFELTEVRINQNIFNTKEVSELWNNNNFEGFIDSKENSEWFDNLNKLQLEVNYKYRNSIDDLIAKENFYFFYQDFSFFDTNGNKKTSPRHLSFIHVVNHATHHIGQVTAILSKYKIHNYPEMDLSYTFNEKL